ncbi:NAD(P)H-binding protein [Paraburkholderia sp. C35]|uniref:NAD(P)-dependent oxidoreductase n=1 Tax=Paraburkholderia sp. C35 TaxID=2126993 RepID=UPI000D69DF50|nr:NAD(P)H-binding protein [Paraburkholderia sp. C35]
MNILIFGATGMIGQRVVAEAARRGHAVTAVSRRPSKAQVVGSEVREVTGDASDPATVAKLIVGQDVVVDATSSRDRPEAVYVIASTLIAAVEAAKPTAPRLAMVGGAGGLEAAPGVRVVDLPMFPVERKALALALIDVYGIYSSSKVNWTYFAPPAMIEPGERTGNYRTGRDQLLMNDAGKSTISAEDFAVAVLDELENPQFLRSRMTAGY